MIDARNYLSSDTLTDGTPVTVRAIRADDRSAVISAFEDLDRESVYTRFLTYKKNLSEQDLHAITDVDFDRVVALVVIGPPESRDALIGGGRYAVGGESDADKSAELAFICSKEWRGRGDASLLLKHLVRIGRERGLARFEAYVLPQNAAMLAVFRRSGLPMTAEIDGDVVYVTLSLASPH
ncbi:GNAT family N-acetyltransferase [Hyphomicrobium sp. CS1GBMeth3]|uniref:GNAT family N-acetyltransferase n=1 Tax=Hyphomicrobium sp. CS1GBMeth3 TaxID=1892845 RepID=UPI000AE350A5|nr:GNAT family N-acetyltransferase [Hyphomicrobium sp. CS1GBMeth3]